MNEQFMSTRFTIGGATDPGIKRIDRPNQDSIGQVLPEGSGGKAPLLVLADGMGGYNGGEIASAIAVKTICDHYRAADITEGNKNELLLACIQKARDAIREKAAEDPDLGRMGSTIVLAMLEDDSVRIANVGDSRAYLISAGGGIRQVSLDHSFVMEQVRMGIITEEEALRHPRRNVLTMSLSADDEPITPFLTRVPWKNGDHILICSDGLWGIVPEAQIGRAAASLEPQEAAETLIRLANRNQGPDNISVMTARNGEDLFTGSAPDITGFNQSVTDDMLPFVSIRSERSGKWKKYLAAGIILLLLFAGASLLLSRAETAKTVPPAAETYSTAGEVSPADPAE